ncbi:MAG: DUF1501 domain-containing protein [Actinobacteria bacterium]|nr:DUF1501 domain-containing protein [Actinomycetota bacterium]
MHLTRRKFLQLSGGAALAWGAVPLWLRPGIAAVEAAATDSRPGRKLLLVLLAGGNDGLNTVIPFGSPDYYTARPTIAYKPDRVLHLAGNPAVGLHPNLVNTAGLFQRGQVAIIQGVGYDRPELSHSSSMDVWHTGSPTHAMATGWLGRWLDQTPDKGSVLRAVAIGTSLPPALVGERDSGVAVPSLGGFTFADGADTDPKSEARRRHDQYLATMSALDGGPAAAAFAAAAQRTVAAVRSVNGLGSGTQSPATLADQVDLAMTLLGSNLGVHVAMVTLGSFDDHSAEERSHPALLKQFDDAVGRFRDRLAKTSDAEDYLLLTFSEFGRRVAESGSGGTDHGSAAPMFAIGPRVAGGLHGQQPSLNPARLDADGNMVRAVELREVYATVLDRWLGGADSRDVLRYSSSSGLHPISFLR